MDSIDGSAAAHAYGFLPSTQKQPSPRLSAAQYTMSDRGRKNETTARQNLMGSSLPRSGQFDVGRVQSTSPSPQFTGRDSPAASNFGFGESQALEIPGSADRRNLLSSPSVSAASASPSLSSASAPFHFAASTSQNTATGMSRFNLASSSNQSLNGLANNNNNQGGAKTSYKDSQTGSGSSNHSRHSSGYNSSLGGGGGGGNGVNTFADFGGHNIYSSKSSFGAGGSSTSLGGDGLQFINGKSNIISVGGLTSALARSNITDQTAIQMAATSSYGSSGAGSNQSHTGLEASKTLSRPAVLRQSFSDGSPIVVDPASPAVSQKSVSSSTNFQNPQAPASTGPLSSVDPRTQLGITNLPYRVRWQDLKDLFRKAGTVLRADVSLTPDNRSKGFGTVLMASEDDAIKACDMFRGFNWQGRTLDVLIDRSGTLFTPLSNESGAVTSAGMSTSVPSPLNGMGSQTGGRINVNLPLQQQLLSHQNGQVPSGISPALYPFLGASNRSSIAAPTSHLQAGSTAWSGSGELAQQRASSMSAGMPQSTLINTRLPSLVNQTTLPLNYPQVLQQQTNHVQGTIFQSGNIPQQQSYPQQQSLYAAPSSGSSSGGMQQFRNPSMSMQPSMVAPTGQQQMLNPYLNVVNPAVPLHLATSLPQAPQSNSYFGRVLFVGNLPFHCQWQDLKDLFRSAGNIQRADVALSAEGKSRGFGTVLFASAEDAQNAVRIYHGYEYSGRTLKVHFDRFAQLAAPLPGTLPATASQYTLAFAAANTPTNISSSSAAQAQHHQQNQIQQQQQQQQNKFIQQQMQQYQVSPAVHSATSNSATNYNGAPSFSSLGSLNGLGMAGLAQNGVTDSLYNQIPTSTHGRGLDTVEARTESSKPFLARPGRITLPPQGFPGMTQTNQNMNNYGPSVPMTPGMPGFTFHAIPQTPPPYHQFLSPGLNGPFSPPLGSPLMGPATPGAGSGAFNPHLNHAPGAPIHFSNGMTTPISNVMAGLPTGYNPMFPPMGMNYPVSPVLHQQSQQHFGLPQTPHWSQPQQTQTRQMKKEPLPDDQELFKSNTSLQEERPLQHDTPPSTDAPSTSLKEEEGYPFPLVSPMLSALSQRRASTNSPAVTPMNGPNSTILPKSPGWERRGSLALNMSSLSTNDPSSSSKLGIRRMLASNHHSGKSEEEAEINRNTIGSGVNSGLGDAFDLIESKDKASIKSGDDDDDHSRG